MVLQNISKKQMNVRSDKRLQTVYCNLVMFLYGISMVMIGTLLPEFINQFSLSMSKGGSVITLQSIGGLATVFGGIALADRVPKATVIIISFLVLGILRFLTGTSGSYMALLIVFFFSGMALRLLDTMLNAFIGNIHQRRRGFHMNILHLFFSLGAFVGPALAISLLNLGTGWRDIYFMTGLVYLCVGIPGLFLMRRDTVVRSTDRKHPVKSGGTRHVIKLEMVLLGLSLLLYAVHQSGITAWLPHYMSTELNANLNVSSYALSIYWIGIILSRLIASRISIKIKPSILVTVGTIITGIYLTFILLLNRNAVFTIGILGIAGAMTGAVIPLSMAIAHDWHPDRTGSSTAYLTLFLLAGHLLSPGLIGFVGDAKGLAGAMLITSISLICCSIASFYARKVHVARARL